LQDWLLCTGYVVSDYQLMLNDKSGTKWKKLLWHVIR